MAHSIAEIKEEGKRFENPHQYAGNFWRYVAVDGLTPGEFKIVKLPYRGVSKVRISFSHKPIPNKEHIQFSLNRDSPEYSGLSIKGPKEDWDYYRIGSQIIDDLYHSLNMQASGGNGPNFSEERGLMETYVHLRVGEYVNSWDNWFAKDPMYYVPKILEGLERGQKYKDISLFALYNDVLDSELPLWKVPESRLVKKGHYIIE